MCIKKKKNKSHLNSGVAGFWLPHLVNSVTALGEQTEEWTQAFWLNVFTESPSLHCVPHKHTHTHNAPHGAPLILHKSSFNVAFSGIPGLKFFRKHQLYFFPHCTNHYSTTRMLNIYILPFLCPSH